MTPHKDLSIGDLVRYQWHGDGPREGMKDSDKLGIIMEDLTMWCSHGGVKPYKMGAMMVMWGGGILSRETYQDLELA